MKFYIAPGPVFFALLVCTLAPSPALAAKAVAGSPRQLTVEVVESLVRGPGRIADFDRIDVAFTDVFARRKWPLTIKVERFAANTPALEPELRIFFQGIDEEAPDELTFRAWMILFDRGEKRDFGIVKFRYHRRAFEAEEDVLEKVVRGAADLAATQVEAALFPELPAPPQ